MRREYFILAFCILCARFSKSDLCVQCYRFDTEGKWKFRFDTKTFEPDVFNPKLHCGHKQPNVQGSFWDVQLKAPAEIQVAFEYPNKFYIINGENSKEEGWWTMIYNVGFWAKTPTKQFHGQFAYTPTQKSTCRHECTSHCDHTLASWYKDLTTGKMGCFYGEKVKVFDEEAEPSMFAQNTGKAGEKDLPEEIKYEDLEFLVKVINRQINGKWKAEINRKYVGKTIEDMKRLMGRPVCGEEELPLRKMLNFFTYPRKFRSANATKSKYYKEDFMKALKESGLEVDVTDPILKYWYTPIEDIKEDELPQGWDWRNIGGVNYINPTRNQGNCGSCFAFGSLSTIEARIHIATKNKLKPILSPEQILSCSSYSEGCDGGEAVTVGKFGMDYEYVSERCFPYTQHNQKCKYECPAFDKAGTKIGAAFAGYLGDFTGSPDMNEKNMMKEIRARGPITIGILVPLELSFYHSGVISCKDMLVPQDKFTETQGEILRRIRDEFRMVEHLVNVVGWGETTEGVKYWVVQNSWGEEYGDKGFFLLKRGDNTCASESDVAAIHPKLIHSL